MREIKFRSWDKDNNSIIYPYLIAFVKRGIAIKTKKFVDIPHFTLMQYTGLKDKNGKEIYEGDILNNKNVVVFDNLFCRFGFTEYDINAFPNWVYSHSFSPDNIKGFEVIGNIYENGDLLK